MLNDNNSSIKTDPFDPDTYFPDDSLSEGVDEDNFFRGVVGISRDGTVEKYSLDNKSNIRHDVATFAVAADLGVSIEFPNNAYSLGLIASEAGVIIIQYSGIVGLVYLPDNITELQQNKLLYCLKDGNFIYEIVHNGEITYSLNNSAIKITKQDVLRFSASIVLHERAQYR